MKKITIIEHIVTDAPALICGHCGDGVIKFKPRCVLEIESIASINNHDLEDFDFEWVYGQSIVRGYCSRCSETTIFITDYSLAEHLEYDNATGDLTKSYKDTLTIKFASPAPRFSIISNLYPKGINQLLEASFIHLFNDKASCANKLRICIESVLDDIGIKKTVINNKGKRQALNAHSRIELLKSSAKSKHNQAYTYLMAIKWIGNTGSHSGKPPSETAIIAAYKLIDKALDILYIGSDQKLVKLAASTIKGKGKIKG